MMMMMVMVVVVLAVHIVPFFISPLSIVMMRMLVFSALGWMHGRVKWLRISHVTIRKGEIKWMRWYHSVEIIPRLFAIIIR